jgi:hypothetical protein
MASHTSLFSPFPILERPSVLALGDPGTQIMTPRPSGVSLVIGAELFVCMGGVDQWWRDLYG